ncbi:MAG: GDSL-type esterase/lipase family protein, partial [Pseudomonadota bacterium]|nr:GDSL-type esterase/lipase family protein [Pseudomonadota bacterium]
MNETDVVRAAVTRRRVLAHCSALLAVVAGGGVLPHFASAAASVGGARILIVGDSLSAEYGLLRGSGWVALLEQRLAREHIDATVVNASISGDTTAGGLARLPNLLRERKPGLVMIELGGNDALRGLPIETTRANLLEMARLAKRAGAKVVIV